MSSTLVKALWVAIMVAPAFTRNLYVFWGALVIGIGMVLWSCTDPL